MNRINNLLDDAADSVLIPAAPSAEWAYEPADELGTSHCVFTPMHYERNYEYPLIVWLHGPAGDEQEVTRIMPLVSMRNYVGVGPRGTVPLADAPGYRWGEDVGHLALAEYRVQSAVAAARRWLNIHPRRIYLAGYGCGGTMALRIALGDPGAFAGVLSIGGAFPSTLRPLGRLHAVRQLKIFLATGRDSFDYPQDRVCRDLRLFHAAGMSVDLRQYPCGDDLTTNMLSDMDRWIMRQFAEVVPSTEDQPSPRSSGK